MKEFLNLDCMDKGGGMPSYPDKHFDLALVDPPFGIGQHWMKSKKTYKYGKKSWNNSIPDGNYFQELFRVSKNQIIWGANYYIQYLNPKNGWLIWDKCRKADKTFMSEAELAWTSFNDVTRIIRLLWDGYNKCEKVDNQFHPNQRPVMLYQKCLKRYASANT